MRYLDVGADKRVSKVGLGTHQFGSAEWGYGERYAGREARAIVRRALDLGVTLFDTAEIYGFQAHRIARRALVEGVALSDVARIPGFGHSEQILGQALGEQRDAAFLATKVYPAVAVRRGPGTAGGGQREPAADRLPGPVPGAPAPSYRPQRNDLAGHTARSRKPEWSAR